MSSLPKDPTVEYYESEKVLDNLQARLKRLITTWDKREQERIVSMLLDPTLSRGMNFKQKFRLMRIRSDYQKAVDSKQERLLLKSVSPEDRETFLREKLERERLAAEKKKRKPQKPKPRKGPFRA